MATININGVDLIEPTDYGVTSRDMDSDKTKRTEAGFLNRSRVRADVYSISIGWDNLTKSQLKSITDAIKPAKITVTFFDPTTSEDPTITMYAGDREAKLNRRKDKDSTESSWSLSFVLTQY